MCGRDLKFLLLLCAAGGVCQAQNGNSPTHLSSQPAKSSHAAAATTPAVTPAPADAPSIPTSVPAVAPSPSLDETTHWLESHLAGVSHTSRQTIIDSKLRKNKPMKEIDRQAINTSEYVSVASFDGCSFTLGQLTKGDDYSVVHISNIPIGDLVKASWKNEKLESTKTIDGQDVKEITIAPAAVSVITLEAASKAITWKRKLTGSPPLDQETIPFEGRSDSVVIHSDDEAMPPRLVNALNHAIQLCHSTGKPEPF